MSFPPITDAATRKALLNRKIQLESRLRQHGITDYPITHLQYLQFDAAKFASPFEVGCRLLCLCAAGFAAYGADERPAIVEWLQRENLWAHVSPREHELYDGAVTDEQQLEAFSWQEEGAYILAWALGLEGVARAQLILFGALPPAAMQFLLAERYQQEPERVAAMILLGNALAIAFVPIGLALAF